MMELYLSSEGKHTVHVSAETPEEMVKLLPQAKLIYEAVVRKYGTKAEMWQGPLAAERLETASRPRRSRPRRRSVRCTTGPWPSARDATAPSGPVRNGWPTAPGAR